MTEVSIQNLRNFELGTQESMNVPIWIILIFQQRDRQESANLNNDNFGKQPVTPCQCIISPEKHPDSGKLLNYDDDDF